MSRGRRRPTLVGLAVFALVATACGSDTESGGADTVDLAAVTPAADTTEDEPPEPTADEPDPAPTPDPEAESLTASFRGVTEDTIRVGISMLDFEFLVESNLSPHGWGDQQLVWATYIADLNARGGINGRMVEAVYEFYNPVGTTEAEAKCLALTADNEVFAVIGGFLGPAEPANTCITATQKTILIGGQQNPERLAQAEAPWLQTGSSRSRRLQNFLSLLDQTGRLADARVAVVGGIQAEEEYEGAGDLLREFGVEPVLEGLNAATSGDIPAEDAQWEVLAERIREADASAVLVIGSTPGAIRGLDRAGLDPEIWVSDPDGLANLGESITPDQADGAITISGLTDPEAWETPAIQECRTVFEAANPEIELLAPADVPEGEDQWFNPIMAYCSWLALFVLVATAAGPDLTQDSFAAAAAELTQFELPRIPFASLGPDKLDASDTARLAVFDAEASPTGELVPLSDVLDVTP